MLLTIDLDSEVPIYQQIRDRVVEAIADGDLVEGSALPSTRQLAADLAINFHTVNKAYDLLRRQGVIRINRKSGAVVRRDAGSGPAEAGFAEEWETRLRTLLAEAVVHGLGEQEALRRCGDVLDAFGARKGRTPA
ncbi:GntR family transcriptional regulator [Nonomuraea sp. NPDC049419]|uniref:GntR family transcriptional regulator n=1 Tax=Nonomuraea sp. NPDC049419 TaxID=3155772 RepID=UPI00342F88DA